MEKYKRLTERDENGIATYKHKCDADSFEENMYIHAKREGAVLNRLAELEDNIENGTLIELPCSDCDVFIKTYRIIKDCSFCAFSLDGDHAPYCKFDDGRKRICQYQIADMYILIDKLKGDEYLSYTQAKNECDRLNYIYACAIKNYLDEYPYEDDIANIVNSITKAEAEKRLKEFLNGKY